MAMPLDIDLVQEFVVQACTADDPPCPFAFKKSLNDPMYIKTAIGAVVASWLTTEGGTRSTWDSKQCEKVSDRYHSMLEKKACLILISRNVRLTSWVLELGKAFEFHPAPCLMRFSIIASNHDDAIARSKNCVDSVSDETAALHRIRKEKAQLVRQRAKVKKCMLSVLSELVTQGELRRVSFVDVNVKQLCALLLETVPAFLVDEGMAKRPTITLPLMKQLMARTLQSKPSSSTGSSRASRMILTAQDIWNVLNPTLPWQGTRFAESVSGWMLTRNVAILHPGPDVASHSYTLLDVNEYPRSSTKQELRLSVYDRPSNVGHLFEVKQQKRTPTHYAVGEIVHVGESLHCAKNHSVLADSDIGLEFQGVLWGEAQSSPESFNDSQMEVHGHHIFQMQSKNDKGIPVESLDLGDVSKMVAFHLLGLDGKALRYSRQLANVNSNARLGIQFNPDQPSVHTLNQACKVVQIVETQSIKMEVYIVYGFAERSCLFDLQGYVQRNSRDGYKKMHQVLKAYGTRVPPKMAAFKNLVKETMVTFDALPSFRISTLDDNLATKINDRTIVMKYQGMIARQGLYRAWKAEKLPRQRAVENVVPITSAMHFVQGGNSWRLLIPSSPLLALNDIRPNQELSFGYGFEEYWMQWGEVRRDCLGVKISGKRSADDGRGA